MSAKILHFPRTSAPPPGASLSREWISQHLPLIDAAMDMLQADDEEFRRRCQAIAEAEGASMLEQLTARLDRLGSHVARRRTALAVILPRTWQYRNSSTSHGAHECIVSRGNSARQ